MTVSPIDAFYIMKSYTLYSTVEQYTTKWLFTAILALTFNNITNS